MPSRLQHLAVAIVCGLFVFATGSDAGAGTSIQGSVTVIDSDGRPRDRHDGVVVFLDELTWTAAAQPLPSPPLLRQVSKTFTPDVLAITVGTTVEFPNDDLTYHNVFSLSGTKPFDFGIYESGSSRSVTFDRAGLVKVYCNVHPQMVASILVLPNPHFAITDETGGFVLEDVPSGSATIRLWSPNSSQHPERRVRIASTGLEDDNAVAIEELHFEVRPDAVRLQHRNKWGMEYPTRY